MSKPPQQVFSPHISRGYTAQQNPQPVNGVVDLLVQTSALKGNPAECEIWDYKGTSRINLTPSDLATYEFQMRVYARLYTLRHGVRPRQAILYFLNELDGTTPPTTRPMNALLSVSLAPHEIDTAVQAFTQTVGDIEAARLINQWHPAMPGCISEQDCTICDLRWDCSTPNNGQGVTMRYP